MSIAENQGRTFLRLVEPLRMGLRTDATVPAKFEGGLRMNKGLGSRDRRLYRELFYTFLRHLPWLENLEPEALLAGVAGLCADTPATRLFKQGYAGATMPTFGSRDELLPSWLREECPEAWLEAHRDCLLSRAPLWLRAQAGHAESIIAHLNTLGVQAGSKPELPSAVRVEAEIDLTRDEAFLKGTFEIQDIGSQLVLASCPVAAGGYWLDACAGAGGKTLQLARLLGPEGRVDALDPRQEALAQLGLRAKRAGLSVDAIKGTSTLDARIALNPAPSKAYDGVLVDAPCSGSGTWRRSPHLKWCTTPETLARVTTLQRRILREQCQRVRPGGVLVYATCSLCRSENEAVLEGFLKEHPHFSPVFPPKNLRPWDHDGDGFFVACVRNGSSS